MLTYTREQVNDCAAYYAAPNEDTDIWRSLVKGLRVNRAAAISSSGEVGLFTLLPTVRKDLVLIDHSKRSLCVAMLKYLLLQEVGPTEAHKLLTAKDSGAPAVKAKLGEIKAKLPEDVRELYARMSGEVKVTMEDPAYYTDTGRNPFLTGYQGKYLNPSIRDYWKRTPVRLIRKSAAKLGKVQFVHGDMRDLKNHGTFDLLYLSNALEHANVGTTSHVTLRALDECLNPGGYALVAAQARSSSPYYRTRAACSGVWDLVQCVPKKGIGLNWDYILFQKPKEAKAA